MNVNELVDIALAAVDSSRVDVELLEPAGISTEAVSALSQIVAELVENATAFSGPQQRVRVNGLFESDTYLFTISDDGVGISESMLAALNRILQRPVPPSADNEVTLGITLVARLAARHGIGVKLVPGVPGTTARISVPSQLVSPAVPGRDRQETVERASRGPIDDVFAESPEETIDLSRYEGELRPAAPRHVVSMTEQGLASAETFLESVFGSLRSRPASDRDRPAPRRTHNESAAMGETREPREMSRPPIEREPRAKTATLRTRVPGENFSLDEDEPSIASSEAAIDIKSALVRYERGRRDARESGGPR